MRQLLLWWPLLLLLFVEEKKRGFSSAKTKVDDARRNVNTSTGNSISVAVLPCYAGNSRNAQRLITSSKMSHEITLASEASINEFFKALLSDVF